ncbi:unnamed protein product [Peniophora sp. CBMAI 1063]|nr:unnamed protein product [Peniophora sp. CBMAI 1063]
MDPEGRIHFNPTCLEGGDSDSRDCVVIRGFNPGIKTKFEAIVDTYQLSGALALRFNSEAAALRYWRTMLSIGNEISWLGSSSVEERLAFREVLCRRLEVCGTVIPQRFEAARIGVDAPSRGPPVRRTPDAPVNISESPQSPPPSPRRPVRSSGTRPITSRVFDGPAMNGATTGPISYAPPPDVGLNYRPRDLPLDYQCRGNHSQCSWYVAWKNRRPGIYCNWDHVVEAHGDCIRKRVQEGHMTYASAIAQWVTLRDSGEIRQWA